MALTISRKDMENLNLEISAMQFTRDFIARRIRQECDLDSKAILEKTLEYFNNSIEAYKIDAATFVVGN